jgi:uncharacterized membrane protein YphA (DoxX/SURF4 family)
MIPQLQREAAVSASAETNQWSLSTKIAFRLFFTYFLLYVYPRPVGSLGAAVKYSNPLKDMWYAVVPWVGANVLHLKGNFAEVANGSGDQLYDYVLLFCIAVTAVVATAIWSVLDRKRPNYDLLYQWVRVFVRIVVAVAMISYGANKLCRMQFPEPDLARYVDTYGQSAPMGLLWAFMGTSHAYSIFGGIGEMLGGLLLLVPSLTTLGSLITVGVMTNVLMLNFCYDVPRKIYCIHLIAFCLVLLIPDMTRLADLFIFNRKVQLEPPVPLSQDKMLNRGIALLQIAIGIGALVVCFHQAHADAVKNETHIKASLRGIWSVDEFALNDVVRPPLLTDNERWQRVIFDSPGLMTIQTMDGMQTKYYVTVDDVRKKVNIWDIPTKKLLANINYDDSNSDQMIAEGQLQGQPLSLKLKRVDLSDPKKFLLLNRGVHWVNDHANNR